MNPQVNGHRWMRWVGGIAALLVVLFPIAYVAWRANQQQAAPQSATSASRDDLPGLEAKTKSEPSIANRLDLSLAYINHRKPGMAIPVLLQLVREQPSLARAWNNLCVAHTMQQDYGIAMDECQRAMRLDPGLALAKNNLQWANGERVKAIQEAERLEETPAAKRDAPLLLGLGLLRLHIGEYDRAISTWNELLAIEPENANAMNDMGIAYMMKKDPATAKLWFQRALGEAPDLQLARNNLAWATQEETAH